LRNDRSAWIFFLGRPTRWQQLRAAVLLGIAAAAPLLTNTHPKAAGPLQAGRRTERSFTPSMQLQSSPASSALQGTTTVTTMVEVSTMLEREEKLRQEHEIKVERLRQEMESKMEAKLAAVMQQLKESEAKQSQPVTDAQLSSLQDRLEALLEAQLLTDELGSLENIVADGVVEVGRASLVGTQVLQMALLSEVIAADRAFARQLRRKFL